MLPRPLKTVFSTEKDWSPAILPLHDRYRSLLGGIVLHYRQLSTRFTEITAKQQRTEIAVKCPIDAD